MKLGQIHLRSSFYSSQFQVAIYHESKVTTLMINSALMLMAFS